MAQRIVITGVAGFIGSHLAKRLLKQKKQVLGIDNLNDYYSIDFKKSNLKKLSSDPNLTFEKIDILEADALEKKISEFKADAIVHLAARAGVRPSIQQPKLYQRVNIEGTLNILEIARKTQISKIVLASSSSVYGNQKKVPFSESDAVDLPISPYAATKKATELFGANFAHLYGMNVVCLRFFTVYGPAGRPDMAPYLFTEAILKDQPITVFGDGSSQRDYTYIDDIISGVEAAIDLEAGYQVLNLGNNTPIKLSEFLKTLQDITGKKAKLLAQPMPPGDVFQTYADISKAKQLLDYQPKTSFRDGLAKFVEWFKMERLS